MIFQTVEALILIVSLYLLFLQPESKTPPSDHFFSLSLQLTMLQSLLLLFDPPYLQQDRCYNHVTVAVSICIPTARQ